MVCYAAFWSHLALGLGRAVDVDAGADRVVVNILG